MLSELGANLLQSIEAITKVSSVFALGSRTASYLTKRIKFSFIVPEKGPSGPPAAFQ